MIVFMVEEESMEVTLRALIASHSLDYEEKKDWICITHQGKSDLEASIPRKLKAWRQKDDVFVILRDQDQKDCILVKQSLQELCGNNHGHRVIIRVVCRELESWFLGDLNAVANAIGKPKLKDLQNKRLYRQPDTITEASKRLSEITSIKGKVSRARMVAHQMNLIDNRSHSFQVFMKTLDELFPQ